jgi:hypothetical protein
VALIQNSYAAKKALTDRIQAPLRPNLVDAELEGRGVEIPRRRDGYVVGEVVGVVLFGWSCGLLDRLVVPVVCPP